jgi:hypothetical protein
VIAFNRPKRIPWLGLAVISLVGAGCYGGGVYGPLAPTCPQLVGSGDPLQASYSANARANAKIRTFVAASRDLVEVSVQAEGIASEACMRMARDLGIPDSQIQSNPDQPGGKAQGACSAVAARIDAIFREGLSVQVTARPPACQANLQAKAQCEGACNVEVDPGEIVAHCDPGRLSGYCQGECGGHCDGTCRGRCDGQCSARDANGQCAGRCDGNCHGGCDATCHAECRGQWQAPKCEGYVRPPSADAECQASCSARADFQAQCTPAQVTVRANQNAEMAARLVGTLQANLPELIRAEVALGKRVAASAQVVVQVGAQLPKLIGNAGAQALACVAAASSASVKASARIDVTIRASASVTGRVGAGT